MGKERKSPKKLSNLVSENPEALYKNIMLNTNVYEVRVQISCLYLK